MVTAHIDLFDIDFLRIFEVAAAFDAKLKLRLIFGSALWAYHRKSLLIVKKIIAAAVHAQQQLTDDTRKRSFAALVRHIFHTYIITLYSAVFKSFLKNCAIQC